MENKKFEQLIDLIINEQEDKAKELFHEIVVEKSREIYENIMDEEMMGEEGEEMVGEVGDLMAEISAEETGDVVEAAEDDEADIDFDDEAEAAGDDLTSDLEDAHDEEGEVDKEDLENIKDKLDDLMAEFEAIMGGAESSEDMGGEEEVVDVSDEEGEEMMEAVQLQKVSVTHGDDGANKKSVVAANSGAKGMDSKPVKFAGDAETVPTGPKGPSNEYSKKEGELPGAGSFKNVPGGKAKVDLSSAPKPVTKDGSAYSKSPVAKG